MNKQILFASARGVLVLTACEKTLVSQEHPRLHQSARHGLLIFGEEVRFL